MDNFGLSFAPTEQNAANNSNSKTPISDAIKVLSLRIPSFVGARGIAPGALLGGMGSGGVPGAAAPGGIPGGLDDWLRRMLMGMGNPMGGAPTPSVIPGDQQRMGPVADAPDGTLIGGISNPGTIRPGSSQPAPVFGAKPPYQQLP